MIYNQGLKVTQSKPLRQILSILIQQKTSVLLRFPMIGKSQMEGRLRHYILLW